MNETQLITKYQKIMSQIEDRFTAYSDIPVDVQMYYLLASLIALQSFKRFYQRYAAIELDPDFAEAGKVEWLNMGPLTAFEKQTSLLWSRYCAEIINQDQNKKMYLAPPPY